MNKKPILRQELPLEKMRKELKERDAYESRQKYLQSDAFKKYRQSDAYKKSQQKYRQSDAYKEYRQKYQQSDARRKRS